MADLRRAMPEDAARLADLGARTFRDAYTGEADHGALDAFVVDHFSPRIQAAELADPATRVIIACVDETPVGYAYLRDETPEVPVDGDRPILLSRLYVDGSAQGLGLGRALFEWCLEEAARLDRNVLWLTVWERNPRAIAIYRRWGFAEVGEVRFPFGDGAHRDLVMARPVRMPRERAVVGA